MMRWHVYGARQAATPQALAHGLAGVWMAALVGPTEGPPSASFDLASVYGPTMAAGLGPLPYLASTDRQPTLDEIDHWEKK